MSGNLKQGETVDIFRSEENSPNTITHIYTGNDRIVQVYIFKDFTEEKNKLCESIKNDIEVDRVPPEQIVVISLNPLTSAKILGSIQNSLWALGVDSIIPGVHIPTSEFGIKGKVTLTHVFRAKGNEAGIIYVINAEQMASYTNEIEARNRAFTAISRSKGWVRILGSGPRMEQVNTELQVIIKNIPHFVFTFPDPDNVRVRNLDAAQTTIRRRIVKAVSKSLDHLGFADIEAIQEQDPDKLREIHRRLGEVLGDNSK
jgi:superfamily I DNA and RNA helicase